MTGGDISIIVGLLTTLGGGVAWLVKRHDAAKDPIPKAAAELAVAEQALGIIKESRDALREDVSRLKEERDEHKVRLDAQQEQIDTLRDDNATLHATVEQIKHLLSHATRFIETLLRWAKDGAKPPQPTLPHALEDLIDPTLYSPPAAD
ncbi:hypothetical protein [Terrabacter sp. NPDC000476]|uniref:hypothetical protein n=1 Tax=Terrabacter sp. NPDC000476 TaxID=3154258 RepID=UPI00332F4B0A